MVVEELIAQLGWDLTGEQELKKFKQGMSDAERGLSAFASRMATFATAAATAFAGGMAMLGKSVISTSAEFEKYQTTLETLEGSSEKAKSSMDWVADFAKKTPFDLAQVTESFVRLRAYGLDPMDGTLTAVGDAASAMGKGLMQGVEAVADAATGEFERLKEFGIKSKQAGDTVVFTWSKNGKEMTKTVKKTSTEIVKFLKENMGERFNGAMLRQSKTWDGLWANLGDSWTGFQKRIGDKGFFETMKGHLGDLLDYVGSLDADGTLDRWATNISGAFTKAVNVTKTFATQIGRHIGTISDLIEKNKGAWDWFKWLAGALAVSLFPVTALLAGAAIALDEWLTYMRGGKTVIGDFIQSLADFMGADPDKVADVLGKMATGAAGISAAAIGVGAFAKALRALAGSVGLFGTGAAAAGSGTLLRLLGIAGAAWGGIEALTHPDEKLKNAPRSKTGVDDAIRWLIGTDKPKNSSHPYAGISAPSALSAPDGSLSVRPEQVQSNRRSTQAPSRPDDGSLSVRPEQVNGPNPVPGWSAVQQMLSNMDAHMAKMSPANAVSSVANTLNDSRDQSMNPNITINQTVQQATDAPMAAARATAGAVSGASAGRSSGLPPTRTLGTGAF